MLTEHRLGGLELCIWHPTLGCILWQLEFIWIVVHFLLGGFLSCVSCTSSPSVTTLNLVAARVKHFLEVLDLSLALEVPSCGHGTRSSPRTLRRVVDLCLLLHEHLFGRLMEHLWLYRRALMVDSNASFKLSLALLRFQIVDNGLSKGLVTHEILTFIEAVICIWCTEKLFFFENVGDVRVWLLDSRLSSLVTSWLVALFDLRPRIGGLLWRKWIRLKIFILWPIGAIVLSF